MPARRIVPIALAICALAAPTWAQDATSPPDEFLWGFWAVLTLIVGFILLVGWRFGRATGLFAGMCYVLALTLCMSQENPEGMAVATAMYAVALAALRKEPLSRALKVGVIALAVGGSWYTIRESGLDRVRSTTQKMLDGDGVSPIRVIGVDAPKLAFIPLIGPAEWQSFIILGNKDSETLPGPECPSVTGYRYKAAGGKFLVQLQTERLRACEAAMGKVKT